MLPGYKLQTTANTALSKIHTHQIEKGFQDLFSNLLFTACGRGNIKRHKTKGMDQAEKRGKTRSILPASSRKFSPQMATARLFLHGSSSSGLHVWIKNTPSIKQLTKERRYSSENRPEQKGSENSRFEEYQYLHDQTDEALKRRPLVKQLFK